MEELRVWLNASVHSEDSSEKPELDWGQPTGQCSVCTAPPDYVLDCMGQLETFIHQEGASLPLLIRAGLVHAQFESIHPFLDGNGRVGRLLITFMLCAERVLREPVLYLSLFFKKHRRLYYDRLDGTRGSEGWTEWLDFFLQGVRDTANQAARTAGRIDRLFRTDIVSAFLIRKDLIAEWRDLWTAMAESESTFDYRIDSPSHQLEIMTSTDLRREP